MLDDRCKAAPNLNELTSPQKNLENFALKARISTLVDIFVTNPTLSQSLTKLQELFATAITAQDSGSQAEKATSTRALVETLASLTNTQYCSDKVNFEGAKKILASYLTTLEKEHNI